jgi:hypothetical protein
LAWRPSRVRFTFGCSCQTSERALTGSELSRAGAAFRIWHCNRPEFD